MLKFIIKHHEDILGMLFIACLWLVVMLTGLAKMLGY